MPALQPARRRRSNQRGSTTRQDDAADESGKQLPCVLWLLHKPGMLRFGLIVAAAIVLLDQASKYLVLNLLGFSPPGCREFSVDCGFIEVSPIFDLSMVWNRGVSFGMLRADSEAARWALVALQFAISGLFGWWLLSARNRLVAWGFALVIGGALGNVIDRIRYGAVVDFLDFRGLGFPWVFNVADAAINVGAGLLILDLLLQARAKREAPPPTAS